MRLIDIGGSNVVMDDQIILIGMVGSRVIKNYIDQARKNDKLLDTTGRNKTRSVIFTTSGFVILSRMTVETMTRRVNGEEK